jgi:two-component system, NarL family, response regulator LiaR
MSPSISILIVDDHPLFRQGLVNALHSCEFEKNIYEAGSGHEALEIATREKLDIVLMDINMPKMDGLECSKLLLEQYPALKIIGISSFEDKWTIEQMIDLGAKGYLTKNIGKPELEASIKNVYAGKMFFSTELVGKMLQRSSEFMTKENTVRFDELHEREKHIIKLIFEEYSSVEIAEKLRLSEHTVNTYRKSLLSKTGAKNVVGLIKYAFKSGWF